MAAKRKTKRRTTRGKARSRRGRRKASAGFGQKLLVGLSGVLLVLCAASITHSYFFRSHKTEENPSGALFRMEVLNGTGRAGLAHAVAKSLRRRGIDVINVDNADRFDYAESIVMARRSGVDRGELKKALGCDNVVEQHKRGTIVDATLILGSDYHDLRLDWEIDGDLLD